MALRGRAGIAGLLLALAACGGKDDAPAAAARPETARFTGRPASGPACPKTGHWSECQVFARLDQAGVAPRGGGTIGDLPQLGATPKVYMVGKSGLAVYLFPDAAARERAARRLDTLHFVAPSAALTMRGEATAIQDDNLLALLYSRSDQQRERVSDALMAGAPQPAP